MSLRIFGYFTAGLSGVARQAREFEELGFDGAVTEETSHDPFFPLLIAAEHTNRLRLMTGIAIGFARTPMLLATVAHDLNSFSRGRFTLSIGSQIEAHITRRFSMPWSKPAARMKEMVLAIRAIFGSWYDGEKLDFKGEFYTHNLMPPLFRPSDTEHGKPPIYVAAVGPLMTQVAGAVADGMFVHTFTTEQYLRHHTLVNLKAGLDSAGRDIGSCRIAFAPFIVSGTSSEMIAAARASVARQLAFYASTPAYRAVLDEHGWGDLQPQLHAMTREGHWDDMAPLVSPEMLETFAVIGSPEEVGNSIWTRYGPIVQDLVLSSEVIDLQTLARIGSAVRAKSRTGDAQDHTRG